MKDGFFVCWKMPGEISFYFTSRLIKSFHQCQLAFLYQIYSTNFHHFFESFLLFSIQFLAGLGHLSFGIKIAIILILKICSIIVKLILNVNLMTMNRCLCTLDSILGSDCEHQKALAEQLTSQINNTFIVDFDWQIIAESKKIMNINFISFVWTRWWKMEENAHFSITARNASLN